eukprot:TRINITY_DN15874_c0_g1_i11.p1 TRINITY_DN15874_c0_g1~~TRINITY_DN15874_c0_g1_i11.p1  ORF type:complete len:514 (+),score=57.27 TRINITY_DN15874_c0_g1_i11:270-1811(+)
MTWTTQPTVIGREDGGGCGVDNLDDQWAFPVAAWENRQVDTPTWRSVRWADALAQGPKYVGQTMMITCLMFATSLTLAAPLTFIIGWMAQDAAARPSSSDASELVMTYVTLHGVHKAMAHIFLRWAVMGVAWHGFRMSIGRPLCIAMGAFVNFVLIFVVSAVLKLMGVMSLSQRTLVILFGAAPPNTVMVAALAKLCSRNMSWSRAWKVTMMSTALELVCTVASTVSLEVFYTMTSASGRIAVRFLPLLIRRLWIYGTSSLVLKFDVTQEGNRFLLLLWPIATTSIVGTCMQLEHTINEVVIVGLLQAAFEVMDAVALLSGSTQFHLADKWVFRPLWRRAKTHLSITPTAPTGQDSVASARLRLQRAHERDMYERRKPLLQNAAVQVCVAEASSLLLVGSQLLILPLARQRARVSGGAATSVHTIALALGLSLAFELGADGLVAVVSNVLAQRWPNIFVSAHTPRVGLANDWISSAVAIAVIAFVHVDSVGLYLGSLCPHANMVPTAADPCQL